MTEHTVENESTRCDACDAELPPESAYCTKCGARASVEPRHCASCGGELPTESAYCTKCGARTGQVYRCASCGAELPPQGAYCSKCGARNELRVRYSLWRVGILTLLSFSLYYFYWMYASWKHLSAEMPGKEFHPVWHAMSQLVPIYNFVVIYQHFRTIREVQGRERVESNLVPGLGVILSIVLYIISISTWNLPIVPSVVISIIVIIGVGFVVLWGQWNLNGYWERPGAPPVRSARTGPGEIVISAVGGMVTALVLIGIIFLTGPSISSVYEADSFTSIEVGAERRGSIGNSLFEVDAYRFAVRQGTRYAISVDPIATWAGSDRSDPLESAIVALWDWDGTTVLREVNANTPIVIPWTASSSGTMFVTIESDGIALGNYALRISAR